MHTIHWHGLIVDYRMDGVPFLGQDPVMRGERYRNVFPASPTKLISNHSHFGTSMHMQAGMYGAFIVERADDPVHANLPTPKRRTTHSSCRLLTRCLSAGR